MLRHIRSVTREPALHPSFDLVEPPSRCSCGGTCPRRASARRGSAAVCARSEVRGVPKGHGTLGVVLEMRRQASRAFADWPSQNEEAERKTMKPKLKSLIDSLWDDQEGRCWLCDQPMERYDENSPRYRSRDHIIPRAMGGTNAWHNIMLACKECNTDRGLACPEEYRTRLQADKDRAERTVRRFLSRPPVSASVTIQVRNLRRRRDIVKTSFGPQRGLGRPGDE